LSKTGSINTRPIIIRYTV